VFRRYASGNANATKRKPKENAKVTIDGRVTHFVGAALRGRPPAHEERPLRGMGRPRSAAPTIHSAIVENLKATVSCVFDFKV
jgi:hypothetical protein